MSETEFEKNIWGLSVQVDLKQCDPELIRSAAHIQDYVIRLCKLIDMKRYGDIQIVNFGSGDKAGYTMVQLIETSCITAHFSNDLNAAFIDVFSCKPFDPETVASFSMDFFKAQKVRWEKSYR